MVRVKDGGFEEIGGGRGDSGGDDRDGGEVKEMEGCKFHTWKTHGHKWNIIKGHTSLLFGF